MTLWKWSTDPATNGSADSTCPFPEGMAPSQVNDSARGIMAAAAKYRDDISGKIVTGGTSTAYTITSNQGFDTLAHLDGAMIAFVPHTTSGAAPTLNVDGLGAKPLRGQSGTDLLLGVLLEDTPYVAFYNNTAGEFVLHSYFVNPGEIPIGCGMEYWGSTVPSSNFVFAYGQAISRTDYPICFARLGTAHGSGDGSTTFNLPDKRGRVSAALDNMGGTDAARLSNVISGGSVTIGNVGGEQTHTIARSELVNLPFSFSGTQGTVNVTSTDGAAFISQPIGISVNTGASASAGTGFSIVHSSGSFTPSGTISPSNLNGNVSQTAMNVTQPTIICNYILRVK